MKGKRREEGRSIDMSMRHGVKMLDNLDGGGGRKREIAR